MWYVMIDGHVLNAGMIADYFARFQDYPGRAYAMLGADVEEISPPSTQLIFWDRAHQGEKSSRVNPGTVLQLMANAWNAAECSVAVKKSDEKCPDLSLPAGCGKGIEGQHQWIAYLRTGEEGAGCSYTITYEVSSPTGYVARSSVTLSVEGAREENPPGNTTGTPPVGGGTPTGGEDDQELNEILTNSGKRGFLYEYPPSKGGTYWSPDRISLWESYWSSGPADYFPDSFATRSLYDYSAGCDENAGACVVGETRYEYSSDTGEWVKTT